jgi:protein-disulfide isomerase
MKPVVLLLLAGLLVGGCAPIGGSKETAATPAVAMIAPTEPAATGAQLPVDDAGITYGRTDEGVFFLGSPDAPVTIIDYSDFL